MMIMSSFVCVLNIVVLWFKLWLVAVEYNVEVFA